MARVADGGGTEMSRGGGLVCSGLVCSDKIAKGKKRKRSTPFLHHGGGNKG